MADFILVKPNYGISPISGMARSQWVDAAEYLLEGAFGHIQTIGDDMVFPKQHEKTYPNSREELTTEKLEGFCRTLLIAAPLLREKPNLVLNSINVSDYYRSKLLNIINPDSQLFIAPRGDSGPSQILVEFGTLAISLSVAPERLWDPLSPEEKKILGETMLSYGNGPTINSNWRFFNIFILSFFRDRGFDVNEQLTNKLLEDALASYSGDGWYNDSPAFDYYSMWSFQVYGPVWAQLYGYKYYPEHAKRFMDNLSDVVGNYPYLFSEKGEMNMWGRSISYRFASIAPLALTGYLGEDQHVNYGWMRRIASSTMLQFIQNPDFLETGVPTLGFYGPFERATQVYSCRGSVYWLGKAFLALLLPEENVFWTAKENNGPWENEFRKNNVYNNFQIGSNQLITNYPNSGASEIRSWCHETVAGDWQEFRSGENYNKLAYNTAFPWMADGKKGEIAMNYGVLNGRNEWEVLRLYTFVSFINGVYRRDAELETCRNIKLNLADIPLPNGILRVDKVFSPVSSDLVLGHYSLPRLKKKVAKKIVKVGGRKAYIVSNGEYQLAMIALQGWSQLEIVETEGLNPVSRDAAFIRAKGNVSREKIFVTLQLWKRGIANFTREELSPVKDIKISKDKREVVVFFHGYTTCNINF